MDASTLRFFISLVVTKNLYMRLMDVVTTYLYGSLDNDIHMKIPEWYKMHEACNSKSRSSDNLVDLFTKYLPTATFKKIVYILACVDLRIFSLTIEDLHTYEGK